VVHFEVTGDIDADPVAPNTIWSRVFILFINIQRLRLLVDVVGGLIRLTLFGHLN
jgi:hypothetical protein